MHKLIVLLSATPSVTAAPPNIKRIISFLKLSFHSFKDYNHIVKLARNVLLNVWIEDESNTKFNIQTVVAAINKYPEWKDVLTLDLVYPTDRMDIDPVLALINSDFTKLLQNDENKAFKAVGLYLEHIRHWYQAWNDDTESKEVRLERIQATNTYFKSLNLHGSEVSYHIDETTKNMIKLCKKTA